MGVHYIAADQVEECWQLLRQSLRSVSYECLAHVPGYSAWLRARTGPAPTAGTGATCSSSGCRTPGGGGC